MRTDASTMGGLLQQAAELTNRQVEIAKELSSGTRLGTLSNDPLAAADSVRLSSSIAQTGSTLTGMQTVRSRMQAADAALGSVVDRLTSAVSVAVTGASDNPASERNALASQLSSIRDSVLGLANGSYDGSYLFSGTSVSGAPFAQDPSTGAVQYNGDAGNNSLVVNGTALQTSVSGAAVFGNDATTIFGALQDAIGTLSSGNALSATQVTLMRSGLQTVIDQRSVLAASAARLDAARTYLTTTQSNLQADQTAVASSDPVALATELSASQTQRTALLSSLALLNKGSLFDYL